jgi:hypothetical protein
MCLQTVVRIAPALKQLRGEKLDYFKDLIPSDRDLQAYAEMLQPLLVIKQASEALEREKSPTIHLVLPLLTKLSNFSRSSNFKNCSKLTRTVIEAFEANLRLRIPDQGRAISAVCMANFLHPSFKGSFLNWNGTEYYDETVGAIQALFPEVNPDPDSQATQDVSIV